MIQDYPPPLNPALATRKGVYYKQKPPPSPIYLISILPVPLEG